MTPISRQQVKRHIVYTVTGPVIRLSDHTSIAAGYLEIERPDAAPLVPAFASALRREIYFDAQILSESLRCTVEVHASEGKRSWKVGSFPPGEVRPAMGEGDEAGEDAEIPTKRTSVSEIERRDEEKKRDMRVSRAREAREAEQTSPYGIDTRALMEAMKSGVEG